MLQRTSIAELVFWILFVAIAFNIKVHLSYLVLPSVVAMIESLLSNYHKNNQND